MRSAAGRTRSSWRGRSRWGAEGRSAPRGASVVRRRRSGRGCGPASVLSFRGGGPVYASGHRLLWGEEGGHLPGGGVTGRVRAPLPGAVGGSGSRRRGARGGGAGRGV